MNEPQKTKLLLTRKQVANMLGFHPKTVSRWAKRELIPHWLVCNKFLLFDFDKLEKSMEKQTLEPKPEPSRKRKKKARPPGKSKKKARKPRKPKKKVHTPRKPRKPPKGKNISSPKPKKPSRKRTNKNKPNNRRKPNDPTST